jgi:hypothetical protein
VYAPLCPREAVSRDERNDYFGITMERAVRVLEALDARLHTKVELQQPGGLALA